MKPSKLLRIVAAHLGWVFLSLSLAFPATAEPATSQATQWIVVGVPAANSTTGTLTAFQRVGQDWRVVLGPTPAMVGELGVGAPADGVYRTPVGTFSFDQAFGRQPNPGTKMPYFQATDQDWWDEDASSPTYNTHVRSATDPSDITERITDPDWTGHRRIEQERVPLAQAHGLVCRASGDYSVPMTNTTVGATAYGHDSSSRQGEQA